METPAVFYLRSHEGGSDDGEATLHKVGESSPVPRRPTIEELAVNTVPADLLCPICQRVLRDASSANPCGDVYCKDCLLELMATADPKCVLCEEKLEEGAMPPSRIAQRLVNSLELYCENGMSFDTKQQRFTSTGWRRRGCFEVVPKSKYDAHVETCVHRLVACPYKKEGCPEILESGELKAHKGICGFLPEVCGCGRTILRFERAAHDETCEAVSVMCPHHLFGCKVAGPKAQLVAHLKVCPYEAVKLALYKPLAEKAMDEASKAGLAEVKRLNLTRRAWEDTEGTKEELIELEKDTVAMLEEKMKNMPRELLDTMKVQLLANLQVAISTIWGTQSSLSTIVSPSRTLRASADVKGNLAVKIPVFTLEQLTEATDNFSEENFLGKGAFGTVYKGVLQGTPVAVKRLMEGGSLEDFEFEVEVLSSIRHPNTVLLIGCSPEAMAIVYEFLSGGSLDDRIKEVSAARPAIGWVDRIRICSEMAAALLHMHNNLRILHRDLKPSNVLLDHNDTCKLADMGLAKLFGADGNQAVMTMVKGTFGYIDPEWIQTGEFTRSSDIYALGFVILQFLTGQRRIQLVHAWLERECGEFIPKRDLDKAVEVFLGKLDPQAGGWCLEPSKKILRLAIRCTERTGEDRPVLETELQPGLYHALVSARTADRAVDKELVTLNPPAPPKSSGVLPIGSRTHETGGLSWKDKIGRGGSEALVASDGGTGQGSGTGRASQRWGTRGSRSQKASGAISSASSDEEAANSRKSFSQLMGRDSGLGSAGSGTGEADSPSGLTEATSSSTWAASDFTVPHAGGHIAAARPGVHIKPGQLPSQGFSPMPSERTLVLQKSISVEKGEETDTERADHLAAVEMYKAAAAQGNAEAQYNLADCYEEGHGVPQDYKEAVRLYRLAAAQGNSSAQCGLGICYHEGHGVKQDYKEAVKMYKLASAQGNAGAQNNLGFCYQKGHGVQRNFKEAVRYYRMAADQGDPGAQNNLGVCCEEGRGTPKNYKEAVRLYSLAAEQGNARAQCNLGLCFKEGHGVAQNFTEAVRLYRLAADQGNTDAQNNLGDCYQEGVGVPANQAEAVRLYKSAAEQGNGRAQCNLGLCYQDGRGVRQDYKRAVRLFRLAAEQGNARAQTSLGTAYKEGQGVARDYEESVYWYKLAAQQGDEFAQRALKELGLMEGCVIS
eukprot:TRINITY_DN13649_c0_g1_i1.p1 TRINITY_DN13649_c0_g1~~TRINITY_DN13649_c0_g1_i1.p1  ORF type:complete len:1175 (+),score=205.57 TRINITY_DN13649_c0_g1_i1:791-4315(+)